MPFQIKSGPFVKVEAGFVAVDSINDRMTLKIYVDERTYFMVKYYPATGRMCLFKETYLPDYRLDEGDELHPDVVKDILKNPCHEELYKLNMPDRPSA